MSMNSEMDKDTKGRKTYLDVQFNSLLECKSPRGNLPIN